MILSATFSRRYLDVWTAYGLSIYRRLQSPCPPVAWQPLHSFKLLVGYYPKLPHRSPQLMCRPIKPMSSDTCPQAPKSSHHSITNLKMKFILFLALSVSLSATALASPTALPGPSVDDTCLAEGVGCKFTAYGIDYPLGTCCSPLTCTGFTELDSTFLTCAQP